jgi:hypothetical protein
MKALIRWTAPAVHPGYGVLILDFMFLTFLLLRFRITDWAGDLGTLLGTVIAHGANGSPFAKGVTLSTHVIVPVASQVFAYSSDVIHDTILYLLEQGRSLFGQLIHDTSYHNLTRVTVQKIPTRKGAVILPNRSRPTLPPASLQNISSPFAHVFPEIPSLFFASR